MIIQKRNGVQRRSSTESMKSPNNLKKKKSSSEKGKETEFLYSSTLTWWSSGPKYMHVGHGVMIHTYVNDT